MTERKMRSRSRYIRRATRAQLRKQASISAERNREQVLLHRARQSSVILICSNGMGTKLSRLIEREASSFSQ